MHFKRQEKALGQQDGPREAEMVWRVQGHFKEGVFKDEGWVGTGRTEGGVEGYGRRED